MLFIRSLNLLCLFSLLLIACSCSKRQKEYQSVDPGFAAYISGYTAGSVSKDDDIRIEFAAPVKSIEAGQVAEGLFDLDPAVDGSTIWLNAYTVVFQPNNSLLSGQKYRVTFNLGKVLDVPKQFREINFDLQVYFQNFFVRTDGFITPDPDRQEQLEIKGTIRTLDVAIAEQIEKCLQAVQDGKELPVSWSHGSDRRQHVFKVENIVRRNLAGIVKLTWNGAPIGAEESNGSEEFRIPPLGEFTLTQVTSQNRPTQHVVLHFSDPLDQDQELDGLIYFKSGINVRLEVDRNIVRAYPASPLTSNEFIWIEPSIRNSAGNELQSRYEREVLFQWSNPALAVWNKGVIIPKAEGLFFPFQAINLKGVNVRILKVYANNVQQFFQENTLNGRSEIARVGRIVYDGEIDLTWLGEVVPGQWSAYRLSLDALINPDPGAIYRVLMNFEPRHSLYPCSDIENQAKRLKKANNNFDGGYTFWGDPSWYDWTNYDWQKRNDPCEVSYYIGNKGIASNIFASNLGLLVRKDRSGYRVTVTDLPEANPLSGVKITAYNFQQQEIASAVTDAQGHTHLETKDPAYLICARLGKDIGYLRVDPRSARPMSLFEINGIKPSDGLKAYIYGERGVWRPGDTLHLSVMLESSDIPLPPEHPVTLKCFDPYGQLRQRQVSSEGIKGLYTFHLPTEADAPTGAWRIEALVGNVRFVKYVRIETVKPNRLVANWELPEQINDQPYTYLSFDAKWLYGAPGEHLDIETEVSFANVKTSFEGLYGYQFDDITKRSENDNSQVVEHRTNGDGRASFKVRTPTPKSSRGMVKLKLNSKIFEPGGEYSTDYISALCSPFKEYVGFKLEGGDHWGHAIATDKPINIQLSVVEERGQPVDRTVQLEWYELDWNWWWEGPDRNEVDQFVSRSTAQLIAREEVRVSHLNTVHTFNFPSARWGQFLVRAVDTVSGHSSAKTFYGSYSGWYEHQRQSEAAQLLHLQADRPKYSVGDSVMVALPGGSSGRVLISIEKAERILRSFWIDLDNVHPNTVAFQATDDMAPNVYVHATLLQPYGQKKNSLPIRMYGVLPISVEDPATKLNPLVNTPEEVCPNSTMKIRVSEAEGRPMVFTLAVVDEGLLSLTRFNTPNPWHYFYAKEALMTHSWDIYDDVLTSMSGQLSTLPAVGGDEDLKYKEEHQVNRFKPVVHFIGPEILGAGETKEFDIFIPNYFGAVRVMCVGREEKAYGCTEQEVTVKQPIMILPVVPRVLGPGEMVDLPVTVISTRSGPHKVRIAMRANKGFRMESPTQFISFSDEGQKTVVFRGTVDRYLGPVSFSIEARSGSDLATDKVNVNVIPRNPAFHQSKTVELAPGTTAKIAYAPIGIEGTRERQFTLSQLPELNLEEHLDYLIRYPHGCIEQITSAAFPQLFVGNLVQLTSGQEIKIDKNIQAALHRLISFQLPSGGFSYWPGGGSYQAHGWATTYAAHFIIEAENKGYTLPPGMRARWLRYAQRCARNWNPGIGDQYRGYQDLHQAYRLYVLALAGKPEIGAMNRMRARKNLDHRAAWRLAAAYVLVGRKDVGKRLAQVPRTLEEYGTEWTGTFGSTLRDQAMYLESAVYLEDRQLTGLLIKDLCRMLGADWHSTQSRSFALLALSKSMGGQDLRPMKFRINPVNNSLITETEANIYVIDAQYYRDESGILTVANEGSNPLFLSYYEKGIPIESDHKIEQVQLGLSVRYLDLNNKKINVTQLKQGTSFKAVVYVSHPGARSAYQEVALEQLFPSGWQIVNNRLNEPTNDQTTFEYQDIRDDRVLTYFNLGKGEEKSFTVMLNATYTGRYYLPAVYCAPMYDETVRATIPGMWVDVIQNDALPNL